MISLSLNEIKSRALAFVNDHKDDGYEMGDTQKFLIDMFDVFGIDKRYLDFERKVRVNECFRRIDGFYPAKILIEQKSKGEDLEKAYEQARAYLQGLKPEELPTHILVSDFERFHLYDLDKGGDYYAFNIDQFPKKIHLFGFLTGRKKVDLGEEDPVNIKASRLMGALHDTLSDNRYTGHDLEIFLVRVLFCLFAEDSGIYKRRQFQDFIENRTAEDGSDLGSKLDALFEILNTPEKQRQLNLDDELNGFPYVNGKLFSERIRKAAFDRKMRDKLLVCCQFDWSVISPAIFGSLFQYVMDPAKRRNLGAHYTDEKNIMKVIKPLFLDSLQKELEDAMAAKRNRRDKLEALHAKLSKLKFLDPACGCGNFLVITYRELRKIELEVLKAIHEKELKGRRSLFDIGEMVKLDVDQFYGIEIEEFSAKIAEVSLWLVDHQMNEKVAQEFGQHFARIPLKASANIYHGNALRIDWQEVIKPNECSYIIGNPPFYGSKMLTDTQREDVRLVFGNVKGAKVLDYVSCWYEKAARYIKDTDITVGLVSTNSITQGEQVGILWRHLLHDYGIQIHFAHQTFKWDNQASGKAQVFVVIIGFGSNAPKKARLYEYEDVRSEPHEVKVKKISPYLVAGEPVFVERRGKPLCDVPRMNFGSMPNDGGGLIVSEEDCQNICKNEPDLSDYLLPFLGAREFINGTKRYCFWLKDISPNLLKGSKIIQERLRIVKEHREKSKRKATNELASFPYLFGEDHQPTSNYLLMPKVSSERRLYIPMGFFDEFTILSDLCFSIPEATLYHFGLLTSQMHMDWMRYTCGRLKGDYRYSKDIVYNNFPWPEADEDQKVKIESLAQYVLDARDAYKDSSLADLYDPLTMPPDLQKAHKQLDKAVDALYRKKPFISDSERVEMLFEKYAELTENKQH